MLFSDKFYYFFYSLSHSHCKQQGYASNNECAKSFSN